MLNQRRNDHAWVFGGLVMRLFQLSLLRSASALFILCLVLQDRYVDAAVMPPGEGAVPDFYTWTDRIPAAPGMMLRSEPLPMAENLGNAATNIRFLYTSTDGLERTKQVVVSAALFIPEGSPPVGGWPLMAWAHGTVGSADICAPSFAGRSPRDTRYLNQWLAQGYAVVATDYQGLGTPGPHPYGLTRPLAFDILDSIRAVMGGGFHLSNELWYLASLRADGQLLRPRSMPVRMRLS